MRNIRNITKTAALFLITASVLLLTACGSKKKDITVDVQKLADDLSAQTVTSDTLVAVVGDMISGNFALSSDIAGSIKSSAAYMSAGSTACRIAVFECAEASQTEALKKALQAHVDAQAELYASYAPEQVDKLKDAVLSAAGKYVVLAVCDDSAKAKSILKESGF